MRVALFVHCFFPAHFYGTETYTFELAKNLQELGHDPVVVTAVFPGEPRQAEPVLRYEFQGIPVWSIDKNLIPNTRVKDTYYQPAMVSVLTGIVQELRPDVAHVTHLINHTGVLLEVLDSESVPTVATFTDFFGFCYTNRLEAADGTLCDGPNASRTNCLACHLKASNLVRPPGAARCVIASDSGAELAAQFLELLQRIPGFRAGRTAGLVQDIAQRPDTLATVYKTYRAVITPTRFLRRAYERNRIGGNMIDIRYGVDISREPKPERAPGQPLVFGFIGQICAHKGPDLLVAAADAALGRTGYEIHVYGSLDQDAQFAAQLQSRSAGLPIRFLGTFPKEKMRAVLDKLDVLVIPSRWYENSPLVLLNALASHTPVVVSNVEGMTEFVEDGVNGFIFARSRADSLGEVLRKIAADREKLPDLWRNSNYEMTTRTMTEETLQVYEDASGGKSHRQVPALPIQRCDDMSTVLDYHLGCRLPPLIWARINRDEAFRNADAASEVAPFPPPKLMQNVSGLTNERDFASHGADFWLALSSAAPKPLTEYCSVLDFGCGCGRLARMFKGHPGAVYGCDIDARHVAWIAANLPYVTAVRTEPDERLPYANSQFDLIVSISVFTHLDEPSQDLLLAELARIVRPEGNLLLTIHGERAMERALNEKMIWDMIAVDRELFDKAREKFARGGHAFILQQGHFTTAGFRYGITFLPKPYLQARWGNWFHIRDHISGALHDFQDVLVLAPR